MDGTHVKHFIIKYTEVYTYMSVSSKPAVISGPTTAIPILFALCAPEKLASLSIYCILQLNKLLKQRCPSDAEDWRVHPELKTNLTEFESLEGPFSKCVRNNLLSNQVRLKLVRLVLPGTTLPFNSIQFLSDNLLFETYVCKQNTLWISIWVHLHIQMSHTQYITVSNQYDFYFIFFYTSALHN